MAQLAVQRPGARVGFSARGFEVQLDGATLVRRPLHEVDEIVLFGNADLTPAARDAALSNHVDVLYLSRAGRYRGRLVGFGSNAGERRLEQLRALADPERRLELARHVVLAKLQNQRALLQRVRRERPAAIVQGTIDTLLAAEARVARAADLDVLRGLEGLGAAAYFKGFGAAITNPAFVFSGRNRRPPRDPVNAALSFGYTLLMTRVESAIHTVGLDVALGALHEAGRGKPALALDLMEPWRPVLVDRVVLRLVNRGQLTPGDFGDPRARFEDAEPEPAVDPLDLDAGNEPTPTASVDGPAVWLAETGRSVLIQELGAAVRTRAQLGERGAWMLGDIVVENVRSVAACIEGRIASPSLFRLR